MILLALSMLVAFHSKALPQQPAFEPIAVAPVTAPQGVLEPPAIPPRTARGAGTVPPEPPDGPGYAGVTQMTRIARAMLGTIVAGASIGLLIHTCAG